MQYDKDDRIERQDFLEEFDFQASTENRARKQGLPWPPHVVVGKRIYSTHPAADVRVQPLRQRREPRFAVDVVDRDVGERRSAADPSDGRACRRRTVRAMHRPPSRRSRRRAGRPCRRSPVTPQRPCPGGHRDAPARPRSLGYMAAVPLLRDRFQALVDRHVFGIKHSPEEVIGIVSARIPTAFDREVLARVVAEEILPTLLIRQSALYLFEEGRVETLYEQAVPAGAPRADGRGAAARRSPSSGRYLPPGPGAPRALLGAAGHPARPPGAGRSAIWLIGRRDPDDYFPASDIQLLSTVANQIAPMAENVRLYEKAQQEIAQRKAAEEEIRRSEERFRTLFEATLEGIAIVRNGVILEVNHALLAIFGCRAGRAPRPPARRSRRRRGATSRGCRGRASASSSDGTTVDIEIAGKRYVFQGEEVSVVAIRDIAQRKRDEAENKTLQRQLLHSQKMEAIGRLSAGVAHDFNNCLLAIFGYSDLLLERYRDDPFLARNLTGIKEAGQRAAALTKQLLAFARRQPMETRVMDLNGVVSRAREDAAAAARRGHPPGHRPPPGARQGQDRSRADRAGRSSTSPSTPATPCPPGGRLTCAPRRWWSTARAARRRTPTSRRAPTSC